MVKEHIERYEILSFHKEHAVEVVQNLAIDFVEHVSRIADQGTDKVLVKTTLEANAVSAVVRYVNRQDVTDNFLLKPPANLIDNMLIAFMSLKFYLERYAGETGLYSNYVDNVKNYLKSIPFNPSSSLSTVCNHFHKEFLDIDIPDEQLRRVRSQCRDLAKDLEENPVIFPNDNDKNLPEGSKVIYPVVWRKKIDQIFDNGKTRIVRKVQHQIIKDFFKYIYKLAPKADGFEEDKWAFYTDIHSRGDGILTTREIQHTLEYCFYRVDCYRAMLEFYKEYDLDINSLERFVVNKVEKIDKEMFIDYSMGARFKYLEDVPQFMSHVEPVRDYYRYCPRLSIEVKRDVRYEKYEYLNYLTVFECIFKKFMRKVKERKAKEKRIKSDYFARYLAGISS
ncbi:hypothetical protein ROZALSC1DRAFT_30790 [Rozella allomycis CSF55]|uniref:Uncharacterized protein n=1 Tax=Rozella allomycis (strain CSF55) TaxID=988480 RepID=A0A075B3A9_ROZAC|nr:hypothetical protein O9G_002122 [Rozella allomycis CSF55]RKP17396.1 hypothetical protein ROZALSC1DRAFT_30790 [Rozella allomycis CSF55]|eukprot:EPZ36839.1 hypothetical protein O9G_002122 [Rozella allomycis CSF55]